MMYKRLETIFERKCCFCGGKGSFDSVIKNRTSRFESISLQCDFVDNHTLLNVHLVVTLDVSIPLEPYYTFLCVPIRHTVLVEVTCYSILELCEAFVSEA